MQELLSHRNSRCYVKHARTNGRTWLCNPFLGNSLVNTFLTLIMDQILGHDQYYVKKKKGKTNPVTGREGPYGCETIGSQMAVRLSALRVGRPLPPRKIPGSHFC
jgi:hypothetical protein